MVCYNIGSEPNNFSTFQPHKCKQTYFKEFTISLTNGSQSQTVTATNAILFNIKQLFVMATSINASNFL